MTALLDRLAEAGHEAALVGGSLRDLLRGDDPGDWDIATAATPEEVLALFPGASWENRFGTVSVPAGPLRVEVTTYRTESGYRDRRRPEEVRWGRSLTDDLARRDFTINAIAWIPPERLIDPYGGIADLRDGVLRAVGEPGRRFEEDALRLLRAVRFATRFDLTIEVATEAAIRRHAPAAASLSGERVRDELLRILRGPAPPSRAFALMERLGLLGVVLPELAALRGVPQAKDLPGDALDHALRTVDALPGDDVGLRLAGLLHDLGKATTLAAGHFHGHEIVGAQLSAAALRRLRLPADLIERVVHLVRCHMFAYRPEWSDAAVRRFIRRVGPGAIPDLLALRRADDLASGSDSAADGRLVELEGRIAAAVASAPLTRRQLAVDGRVLIEELGLAPGPIIGELLERLMEEVIADPALNRRDTLLAIARRDAAGGAGTHRSARLRRQAPGEGAATIGGPD